MSRFGAFATMNDTATLATAPAEKDQDTVSRFVALATRGLIPMFNDRQQLFCYKLKKEDEIMVQEGLSHRYTMMTLMGLHRLKGSGTASPFDDDKILTGLFADLTWVNNVGDLGVLLWLCGTTCPERFAEVDRRIDVHAALRGYQGARNGVTME